MSSLACCRRCYRFATAASEIALSAEERRAVRRRLGRELFRHLGDQHWKAGERQQALELHSRALKTWPWDLRRWKTYALACGRP